MFRVFSGFKNGLHSLFKHVVDKMALIDVLFAMPAYDYYNNVTLAQLISDEW